MTIELTKHSDTEHHLRCTRADASVEEAQLESKSFLIHDFTHLMYELEAKIDKGFWGSVAAGETFVSLRGHDFDPGSVLWQTEMVVGPLQSVIQDKNTSEGLVEGLKQLFDAHGEVMPDLTVEMIARMQDKFHALMGEWRSLAFGQTMTVTWDVL